mgnify:CR=1 FL=1
MFKVLEKELVARVFMHKVAICRGYLIYNYIRDEKSKASTTVILPDVFLEQQAECYANSKIQSAMVTGVLDDLYNEAWESMKDTMPDDFTIMQ